MLIGLFSSLGALWSLAAFCGTVTASVSGAVALFPVFEVVFRSVAFSLRLNISGVGLVGFLSS